MSDALLNQLIVRDAPPGRATLLVGRRGPDLGHLVSLGVRDPDEKDLPGEAAIILTPVDAFALGRGVLIAANEAAKAVGYTGPKRNPDTPLGVIAMMDQDRAWVWAQVDRVTAAAERSDMSGLGQQMAAEVKALSRREIEGYLTAALRDLTLLYRRAGIRIEH